MTKKDFFRLLIKLFGLYLIILSPYAFSSVASMATYGFDIIMILYALIMLVLYVLFAVLLIAFSDSIIYFLRLDKGFDDDHISLSSIDMRKIICLAIIIVGGILVVKSFSTLVVTLGNVLASLVSPERNELFPSSSFTTSMWLDLIDFVIGLLLLSNYNWLSSYIMKKGGDKIEVEEGE